MNNNDFLKKFLPHIAFIGLFTLILIIYFNKAFFQGRTLSQNDVMQGIAAGKEGMDFREKTGEEPLWTTTMFSGMPLYLTNVYYSGDLVNKIHSLFNAFPKPANTVFLTFICFYILLSVAGCRPVVSFAGAFTYAFATYTIISIEAGHLYKVWAISYMALVFAGILLLLKKRYFLGLAVTSLGVALELGAQHYQITYYLMFILGFFGVSKVIEIIIEKDFKHLGILVVLLAIAGALGVGVNSGRIWALSEYSKYSTRGKSELKPVAGQGQGESGLERDYVFAWSQGKVETLTLLVPDFYGGASNMELSKRSNTYDALKSAGVDKENIDGFLKGAPLYWGDQPFTSGPVYAGVLCIFLLILSGFVLTPGEKYWAYLCIILSIMLSWGKNFEWFNYWMFDHFPGYNKFRAVSMALVIAIFCLIWIGSITLNRIFDKEGDFELSKNVMHSLIVMGVILVGVLLFSAMPDSLSPKWLRDAFTYTGASDAQLPDWLRPALKEDRISMLRSDVFRSIILVGALAALLYLYLRKTIKMEIAFAGVVLLFVFDLFAVDKRFLNDNSFGKKKMETFFEKSEADEMILQDTSNYRVLYAPNAFNNALVSYYHRSVGGYHGAKLKRYQDLIEHHLNKNNIKIYNMLNTKYIITGEPERPVSSNPGAMGNVWFVTNIKKVKSPDDEINALTDFDPSTTAVVDENKFKVKEGSYAKGDTITLVDDTKPNYLKYQYTAGQNAFVVFSEIYYPEGWNAFIDGKPADYVRVNYILRGMDVPAGTHVIEFKFEPKSYFVGNKIMLGSSVIVFLLLIGGVFFEIRKKPTEV